MSDVYMIEVDERSVGLVARDAESGFFRFHAALEAVFGMEGREFTTPDQARREARQILGLKPRNALQDLDCAA
ncbi:hypothetical protein [Terrihabitans rhizophilus]|jgi:hypothetical protein|uniref:Uncharacterized protein n=1 Tax=Terrihabitans rhizophilus TaxID=3092662 RepID=A0ABU4RQB3_9HYPH|nr:hypothetical protein [Terrihabitans sp. PJ23]MDX6807035.1 hypothetical protein [Terrihabitans sp. PJ23]